MKVQRWGLAMIPFGIALGATSAGAAQLDPAAPEHPLHPLAFLEGSWSGEIGGTIGSSSARREYRFVLSDRFLFMTHDRDPGQPPPAGGAPEEWTIFSFDPERGAVVLREFHVEGVVNTYRCEVDAGPTTLTCTSEATEGGPPGLSLAVRYDIEDLDRFSEVFEIYRADGGVQVRIEGRWRRVDAGSKP